MSRVTESARGQPCLVRLPGCDGGGETTVYAHYRLSGYCGGGMKPADVPWGAYACASCHDICDGRKKSSLSRIEVRHAHAEGCLRTNAVLIERGLIPRSKAA